MNTQQKLDCATKTLRKHILKNLEQKIDSAISSQKSRNAWIGNNIQYFALTMFVEEDLETFVETALECWDIQKDHHDKMRHMLRAIILSEFIAGTEKAGRVIESLSHDRFNEEHRKECNDCRDAYNDFLQEQEEESKKEDE